MTGSGTGSQTLARGLTALQMVAASPTGLTVQQLADQSRGAPDHRVSLAFDVGSVPAGRQGRGRALSTGSRPRRARRFVRPQRAPTESADAARAGRRSRHHGLVACRRGRPAGGGRGDRAEPCRLPTLLPRGQPLSTGTAVPPESRCSRACRRAQANGVWSLALASAAG